MDEQYNNNDNKPTFSEQIVYAMFRPSKYVNLLDLKNGRFVRFIIVMMVVLSIVTFVIPTGAVITGFGGFENLFTRVIPALSVEDGKLQIEEPFSMTFDQYNVLIDTDDASPADEKLSKAGAYIAIGSQVIRFAFSTGTEVHDYSTLSLSGLLSDTFTNQTLTELIPSIYTGMFITFVLMCFGFFIKYAFFALLLALIASFANKKLELGISFGNLFKLGFYSESLAMVLTNFNDALGYPLPYIIVNFIAIFISLQFVTNAMYSMAKKNGKEL
jgi:hypothetical protein